MAKIGIVGKKDEIMCFMAAGFSVYPASDGKEAFTAAENAEKDGCAVIYVTSDFAEDLIFEKKLFAGMTVPALLPLPGAVNENGDDIGKLLLKNYVERAVGADILFKNDN